MRNVLPFWLAYRDATFEPRPLGFDVFDFSSHASVAKGLGCPFCHQGTYREYAGQWFVTCDNHHIKQKVANPSQFSMKAS